MFESSKSPEAPLVAEAHHRISNSLAMIGSLVRLQARALAADASPDLARQALIETAARIDALGRFHRALLRPDEAIDTAAYLHGVAQEAFSAGRARGGELRVDIRLAPPIAPARLANIGLILNEMMLNAVKHAHPNDAPVRVEIVADYGDDALTLSVADDGAGLPEGVAEPTGFGVRIMRELARGLGGTLNFASSPRGFSWTLTAPL